MKLIVMALLILAAAALPVRAEDKAPAKTEVNSAQAKADGKAVPAKAAAEKAAPAPAKQAAVPAVKKAEPKPDNPADQVKGFFRELSGNISRQTGRNLQYELIFTGVTLLISLLLAVVIRSIMASALLKKIVVGKTAGKALELFAHPVACAVFFLGIYISLLPYFTELQESTFFAIERLFIGVMSAVLAWGFCRSVDLLDLLVNTMANSAGNQLDRMALDVTKRILKAIIVVIAVLFIGQNVFELNITTLLAGAGVAGLAIAFAAQDAIANFFGSIMILVDRPFSVGELVKIDALTGVVENVGLRSTRLRTLDGNLITVPNKNTAGASIENISVRPYVKSVIDIGITYDTPYEKVMEAMKILRDIFSDHEGMTPDLPPMVNFTEFASCSLNLQVIVWYHPGDWAKNMAFRNRTNLEILKRFGQAGIDMAFPTSTTYLTTDPKRPVEFKIKQDK